MTNVYNKIVRKISQNIDKVLHFTVCLVMTLILSTFLPVHAAVVITLAVGLAKEWMDSKKNNNHWCWWDLLSDALGIVTAVVPLLLS